MTLYGYNYFVSVSKCYSIRFAIMHNEGMANKQVHMIATVSLLDSYR